MTRRWKLSGNPTLLASLSSVQLSMCFGAQVAGVSGNVLFDSGATANFVSASFCRSQGVRISADPGSVTLGNKTSTSFLGKAKVYLKLSAFHQAVDCLVLDELLDGVDLILGQTFMKKHKVDLLYSRDCCTMRKGNRRITVKQQSISRDRTVPVLAKSDALLSALQVKRLMRKGATAFLAVVSEVEDDTAQAAEGHGLGDSSSDGGVLRRLRRPVAAWSTA